MHGVYLGAPQSWVNTVHTWIRTEEAVGWGSQRAGWERGGGSRVSARGGRGGSCTEHFDAAQWQKQYQNIDMIVLKLKRKAISYKCPNMFCL